VPCFEERKKLFFLLLLCCNALLLMGTVQSPLFFLPMLDALRFYLFIFASTLLLSSCFFFLCGIVRHMQAAQLT
jgi:hypothetical protein